MKRVTVYLDDKDVIGQPHDTNHALLYALYTLHVDVNACVDKWMDSEGSASVCGGAAELDAPMLRCVAGGPCWSPIFRREPTL